MLYQLTAAHINNMLAAVMDTFNSSRQMHRLSHPPVAAAPASGARCPGCAGGTRRLDDLRRRRRRRRHSHLRTLPPGAGLAGHVERSRHVDRCPRATRRPAVGLHRWPPRAQQSWAAMPLMSPLGPGLVRVGLVLAWPGVSAAWPGVDRLRPSMPGAVSRLLDDRDLQDDRPSALTGRTTALGLPPATIDGGAAITPTHCWPCSYPHCDLLSSLAQERLWFLDQLEPNSPLYKLPCVSRAGQGL